MEPWPLWSSAPYIVDNITQLCMHFPIRSTPDENNSGLVANLVENLITNPAQRHIELIDQEVAMRWQKKKRRQDAFPFCGQDDAGSTLLRPTPIGLQFVYRPNITSFILTRSFSCTWKKRDIIFTVIIRKRLSLISRACVRIPKPVSDKNFHGSFTN